MNLEHFLKVTATIMEALLLTFCSAIIREYDNDFCTLDTQEKMWFSLHGTLM